MSYSWFSVWGNPREYHGVIVINATVQVAEQVLTAIDRAKIFSELGIDSGEILFDPIHGYEASSPGKGWYSFKSDNRRFQIWVAGADQFPR